jgi:hypothetical protein
MAYGQWAIGTCGCGCAPCNVTLRGELCNTSMEGVTIVVTTTGGAPVASGVTDSSGGVTLDVGSAGTYNVTISYPGLTTTTQAKILTCGGTAGVTFPIPATITITDASTTVTLSQNGAGLCNWLGCYELAGSSPSAIHTGGVCTETAGQSCDIVYQANLNISAAGWNVFRSWGNCCDSFTNVPCYATSGAMNLTTCTGGSGAGSDSGNVNPTVLDFPVAMSLTIGSLTCGVVTIPNPLGAGISIDV